MTTTTTNERIIDKDLKILPFRHERKLTEERPLMKEMGRTAVPVHSSLSEDTRKHLNYLQYLTDCYNSHYGIVVKPDMIWFTILNEVASHIKNNADHYQRFFTRSLEGKIEISVPSDDLVVMPVESLIERLRILVPVGVDQFLPEFSTLTNMGRIAHYASFCDAMSPYYEYSMFMCGISAIRIDGTDTDWNLVSDGIESLNKILDLFPKYLLRAAEIVRDIKYGSQSFWQKIIKVDECGSGGQISVTGWFTDLVPMKALAPRYTENFPAHVAKFDYKQLNTGKEYTMVCGIFESKAEGKYLVPDYGRLVYDKATVQPEKQYR